MDECADRVGAGCCLSLLDDRPSGAVTSYCLAANASVYTLTLEDHLGKAKDLLEGRKLQNVAVVYRKCDFYLSSRSSIW